MSLVLGQVRNRMFSYVVGSEPFFNFCKNLYQYLSSIIWIHIERLNDLNMIYFFFINLAGIPPQTSPAGTLYI